MHFAQGQTPQSRASLSNPNAVSEYQAFQDALDKANEVMSNIQKEHHDRTISFPPATRDLASVREAVQGVIRLPATLLSVSADLSLSDVVLAFKALVQAEMGSKILEIIRKTLEKAKSIPALLRDIPNLPPLSTEPGPPRQFDYGATIKRARIGVFIELSTIPLYMYASTSVKSLALDGLQVKALLRGIIQQEMLHLALAGNLLSALGGTVTLYDPRIVPIYPASLLCSKVPMHLEALSNASIGNFMEIEAPVDAGEQTTSDRNVLASQYDSIGQLYEDLVLSLRGLDDQQFTNNLNNQFVGQDFFGDQLFPIIDQASALKALGTIIEQGEGNLSVENSHYEIFSKLYSGPTWEVYDVPTDPKSEDYILDPFVHRLSLSFDAAYCYLLQTIERVWTADSISSRLVLIRNVHGIMNGVLGVLSRSLIQQKFGSGSAAPCFGYYPMYGSIAIPPLEPLKLFRCLVEEVQLAAKLAPSSDTITDAAGEASSLVVKTIQSASKKAGDVAPGSPEVKEAVEIAGTVQIDPIKPGNNKPSRTAILAELLRQLGKKAVRVAELAQAAARAGNGSNLAAALEAADAATQAKNAAEAAFALADRADTKAVLEKLALYIKEHLYPPF